MLKERTPKHGGVDAPEVKAIAEIGTQNKRDPESAAGSPRTALAALCSYVSEIPFLDLELLR